MTLPPITPSHEPYQSLIDSAETWHKQGHYKEAVILAQTGLELFTEKTLGHLYQTRQLEYLKPEFEHLLINYNIGNSKVSGLYIALSGDEIKQAPFWAALTDHVELRNKLVHDGQDATAEQSRNSLDAVKALISHVQEHNSL
ncbi:MAG: hypothetical protein JWN01_614 [Patescibacteria group bacterium]|nr:hypothetical protein [Patescibacteria group bacterium]